MVYPRVCGEPWVCFLGVDQQSVYPRVCGGNPPPFSFVPDPQRSIPACAGEPFIMVGTLADDGVYPRVCGGTALQAR